MKETLQCYCISTETEKDTNMHQLSIKRLIGGIDFRVH